MLKISNTKVYGLEESIIASGYPMLTKPYTEEEFKEKVKEVNASFKIKDDNWAAKRVNTAKRLGNTNLGEGHSTFLSGIIVQFNINYPVYWTPQFQRYHFQQIVSST